MCLPGGGGELGEAKQGVYQKGAPFAGPWVVEASNATTLPAAATVRVYRRTVTNPNWNHVCTGAVIQRDVVVTAGHCICQKGPPSNFAVETPGMAQANPNPNNPTTVPAKFFEWRMSQGCGKGYSRASDGAREDIAVLVLQRNLTVAELPEVMPIYTLKDFVSRVLNSASGADFPAGPWQFVGTKGRNG